jgi:gliding motility-associated-like protein
MKTGTSIITILALCFFTTAIGQKESFNWYFGTKAGLTFNPSGSPTSVNNSAMQTGKGCAAISDSCTGQLYFYTNGEDIWNRNHTIMPNGTGLDGSVNSTQSAIIVPDPDGSTGQYYLFTVERGRGLKYTIVDINLAAGMGDVVSGKKNIPLVSPTLEKITAVRHLNNKWVWIIARPLDSTVFHSYLLTDTGLVTTPVVSQTNITYGVNGAIGYMKAAPNGAMLAVALQGYQRFDLYDFDIGTGIVSNGRSSGSHYAYAYGVEFSPDASKLYVTSNPAGLWQYDLRTVLPGKPLGDSTFIKNSATVAIQLGADGIIYCNEDNAFLGAILEPNKPGQTCNYSKNHIKVNGHTGSGLPTFMQSYFNPMSIIAEGECLGISTAFSLSHDRDLDSLRWDFGEPSSGSNNTSNLVNPNHLYANTGTYTVTVYAYTQKCGLARTDTVQKDIEIIFKPIPQVDLGNDTIICAEDSVFLATDGTEPSYVWNTGSKASSIWANDEGWYWVTATNECGGITDSMYLEHYISTLNLNLGKDTTICQGDEIDLYATQNEATYLWNTGSVFPKLHVKDPDTYWVAVTDECYTLSDTIVIGEKYRPSVNISDDTTICEGNTLTINVANENATYLWQDFSTSPLYDIEEEGAYRVKVTNECGSSHANFYVVVKDCGCYVYAPNSFTPNSDGLNDEFRINYKCEFREYNLEIYNRWGELIFKSSSPEVSWDGTKNGRRVPAGIYQYLIKYSSNDPFNPENFEKRGMINMID